MKTQTSVRAVSVGMSARRCKRSGCIRAHVVAQRRGGLHAPMPAHTLRVVMRSLSPGGALDPRVTFLMKLLSFSLFLSLSLFLSFSLSLSLSLSFSLSHTRTHKHTNTQTHKHTNRQTHRQTHKHTNTLSLSFSLFLLTQGACASTPRKTCSCTCARALPLPHTTANHAEAFRVPATREASPTHPLGHHRPA